MARVRTEIERKSNRDLGKVMLHAFRGACDALHCNAHTGNAMARANATACGPNGYYDFNRATRGDSRQSNWTRWWLRSHSTPIRCSLRHWSLPPILWN